MRLAGLGLLLVSICVASDADLNAIKAQSNLERRSEMALNNANRAIDTARDAYAAGDMAKTEASLNEVADSVDVSYEALGATGKHPRRSPKHFKKAEVRIREMLRRLKSLETDFNVADRPVLAKTEQRLQSVHDDLLAGIMGPKK